MPYKKFLVSLTLVLLIHAISSELISNTWGPGGSWFTQSSAVWILRDSGPVMPRDGHVHSFRAQIVQSGISIQLGIYREEGDSAAQFRIIGGETFVTTAAMRAEGVTEFLLSQSIEVQAGDRMGFWNGGSTSAIARYASTASKMFYHLERNSPAAVGSVLNIGPSLPLSNYDISLAVMLEDEPLVSRTTTESPSSSRKVTTLSRNESTTTAAVETEKVYGHPDLRGEAWAEVSFIKYASFIIEYDTPITAGILNYFQFYSYRSGVTLSFQIWRAFNSEDITSRSFFLVTGYEHTTQKTRAFENTKMVNHELLDGDLIGFTVVDGSGGIPIGRSSGAGGERMYLEENFMSKQDLPREGRTYSNYRYINNVNLIALAAFVSNEIKYDENVTATTTTFGPSTSPGIQTTTPITNAPITTDSYDEQIVGHPRLISASPDSEMNDFNPAQRVTIILSKLNFRRNGVVKEIGFYSMANSSKVDIGIYRKVSGLTWTTVYLLPYNVNVGPYVTNCSLPVQEGDALGFHNYNLNSFTIGRVGSDGGDSPLIEMGATVVGETRSYSPYLNGYDYAIYAVLEEFISTTTTEPTTTTTEPTTTTTEPTTTTTEPTTTTTEPTTTTTEPTTTTTTEPTTTTTEPTTTTTEPTTTTTTTEPTTTTTEPTTTTTEPTTTTTEPTTTTTSTTTTTTTKPTTTTTTDPTTTTEPTTTTAVIYVTGEPGEQGSKGEQGNTGVTGPPGSTGSPGEKGHPGVKGERGETGNPGDPGIKGSDGHDGANGTKGAEGSTGASGDKGSSGAEGELGLKGAKGERGDKGMPGLPGVEGEPGPNGAPGPPGDKGKIGSPGPSGETGPKGEKGDPGVKGPRGPDAVAPARTICTNDSCSLNEQCSNGEINYICGCEPGYMVSESGDCVDENECDSYNGMCQQNCNNIAGSHICSCKAGYTLDKNGKTCTDVNECSNSSTCETGLKCFNEVGSYKCLIRLSPQTARLVELEDTYSAETWWAFVILGLIIWCIILTIIITVALIVMCCCNDIGKKYAPSDRSSVRSEL